MKKMITTTLAAGMVASGAFAAVSTTFDLASAYVFRGVTLNDGAVFQPGIEASGFEIPEEYGAVAVGAWANYDLDDYVPAGVSGSTFGETDWYLSYSLPALVDGLDLFIGYTEYSYGTGARDEEANIGAGYEVAGVALGLTYYQGVGGFIGTSAYIEGAASYGLDISEMLSASVDATIGFADIDGGENGFNDYSIGATVGGPISESWSWAITGTYIGQGDDEVLPDTVDTGPAILQSVGYDVSFVGMLSLACDM